MFTYNGSLLPHVAACEYYAMHTCTLFLTLVKQITNERPVYHHTYVQTWANVMKLFTVVIYEVF
jgi:hypothetical protein